MATTSVKSNVYVKCGGPSTREKPLSLVGSTKGKREGHQEGEHPLDKLLQQSRTLQLETLTKHLKITQEKMHQLTSTLTVVLFSTTNVDQNELQKIKKKQSVQNA